MWHKVGPYSWGVPESGRGRLRWAKLSGKAELLVVKMNEANVWELICSETYAPKWVRALRFPFGSIPLASSMDHRRRSFRIPNSLPINANSSDAQPSQEEKVVFFTLRSYFHCEQMTLTFRRILYISVIILLMILSYFFSLERNCSSVNDSQFN